MSGREEPGDPASDPPRALSSGEYGNGGKERNLVVERNYCVLPDDYWHRADAVWNFGKPIIIFDFLRYRLAGLSKSPTS